MSLTGRFHSEQHSAPEFAPFLHGLKWIAARVIECSVRRCLSVVFLTSPDPVMIKNATILWFFSTCHPQIFSGRGIAMTWVLMLRAIMGPCLACFLATKRRHGAMVYHWFGIIIFFSDSEIFGNIGTGEKHFSALYAKGLKNQDNISIGRGCKPDRNLKPQPSDVRKYSEMFGIFGISSSSSGSEMFRNPA